MEYTAAQFVERLEALRAPDASGPDDYHGVGMGRIFSLARDCMDMAPAEIELLLESPVHAVRVGAVSVMDFQARDRKTSSSCSPINRAATPPRIRLALICSYPAMRMAGSISPSAS